MAISGTVGATVIDVVTIIESAIRRCGVPSSVISGEQLTIARNNLFLILSRLANRGISLWCVQKYVLALVAGQARYTLPVGTVDTLESFLRYGSTAQATTLSVNLASLTLTSAAAVTTVTLVVQNAGDYSLVFESSPDNVTWTQVGSLTAPGVLAAARLCIDADPVTSNLYWRIRETVAPAAVFSSAAFMYNSTEIMMSKLSRDDYTNYPNKAFQSLNPLQYWYDKQYLLPAVVLWPTPQDYTRQMVLWVQNQIQDPGQFYNTLQVPQRWLDYVIFALAQVSCLELPANLVPEGRYEKVAAEAANALIEAENSETDGAPVRFAPDIAPYTR